MVTDSDELGRAIVMFNQYVLGSTAGRHDEQRQAHLPILLHAKPHSVALIGLATGITSGATLMHDHVESVTAIELSPLVAKASKQYFADNNGGIFTDPRANVVIEDGRTYIASCVDRFDVVVGDLFLPWRPGVGRLYSREHFQAVYRALRRGGQFCQMLPMYQFNRDQQQTVLTTLLSVFPQVHLFRLGFNSDMPVLAMVAVRNGDLDWQGLPTRCDRVRRAGRIRDLMIRHHEAIAMLYLGTARRSEATDHTINTLGNAWIELNAGRDFVTGKWKNNYFMNGPRWIAFEREMTATLDSDPDLIRFTKLGNKITQWDLASRQRAADTGSLRQEIAAALPKALTTDRSTDLPLGSPWRALIKR